MNDKADFGMGIRLSEDGTALALDWAQDDKMVTTILPVTAVPNVIQMLLGATEKAAERQTAKPATAARPDNVFRASDMQLLTTDAGTSWILRVFLGNMKLDFALTKQLANSLQKAVAAPPIPKAASR
jgi:hypothetical protein